MRKFALPALAVVVVLPLALSGAPVASAAPVGQAVAQGSECREPTAVRDYDGQSLTYKLAVDLSGCEWWDHSPIQLAAGLNRFDGAGEHGAMSFALCGGRIVTTDDGETRREGNPTCEVDVTIEHPALDLAHYRGEVTYPWRGGDRTVTFDAVCAAVGSLAGCRDTDPPHGDV